MSHLVKGWCPGALRPMQAGDGLVLRVRPRNGRLLPNQVATLAEISGRWGNGLIDLTARANLQLRGLNEAGHRAALEILAAHDLLDARPEAEARRNVILSPFVPPGGPAWQVAEELAARLMAEDAPPLPGKFGFAVDEPAPVLGDAPADIRLIPGPEGWRVHPEGADWFLPCEAGRAAKTAIDLARWFLRQGGAVEGRGRMLALCNRSPEPSPGAVRGLPAPAATRPDPGPLPQGWLIGFAFGQIGAAELGTIHAPLRLTPWRLLLIESRARPELPDAITEPGDPLMRLHACTGAPRCPQAQAGMRDLARSLAPRLAGRAVHFSGCTKGCAHPSPAPLTVVATGPDRFDLIRGGRAGDPPQRRGLSARLLAEALAPPLSTPHGKDQIMHHYETEGARIYRQSFATIRAEAELTRFDPAEEPVVVRMIHAAGLVGLERDVEFSPGMTLAARHALEAGAPILCDARMVSEGITRTRLPAQNRVICTLNDPCVPELAARMGNTRSAAALELWRDDLAGAVVAIGNAPTALFHLLNMLADPACPRPAAIIGCPVGFVGAAESKAALMQDLPVPALTVHGRLGGSAITVAALNALASRKE